MGFREPKGNTQNRVMLAARRARRRVVLQALEKGGNILAASRILHCDPKSLRGYMRTLGIPLESWRGKGGSPEKPLQFNREALRGEK